MRGIRTLGHVAVLGLLVAGCNAGDQDAERGAAESIIQMGEYAQAYGYAGFTIGQGKEIARLYDKKNRLKAILHGASPKQNERHLSLDAPDGAIIDTYDLWSSAPDGFFGLQGLLVEREIQAVLVEPG